MNRLEITEAIASLGIRRGVIARLCGLHACDLSTWLHGTRTLSRDKVETLTATLERLRRLIQCAPFAPDLTDPTQVAESLERLDALLTNPESRAALEMLSVK